jgi:hypothetical protein
MPLEWLRPSGRKFYKLQLLNSQGVGLETLGSVRAEGTKWKAWDSRSGEEKAFKTRHDAMVWVKGKNKDAQPIYASYLDTPRRLKPGEGKKMYRNPNYYEAMGVSGEEFTNFGSFDCAHDAVVYAQGVADSDAYDGVAVLEEVGEDGARKWWVIVDENELMEHGEFEEVDVEENPSGPKMLGAYKFFDLAQRYVTHYREQGKDAYLQEKQGSTRPYQVWINKPEDTRKRNPFPFKKCIKRARAKGIGDPNAYCATVDRRMHQNPENAPELVFSVQHALQNGKPIWVRTHAGAWGVREIKLSSDKRQALVKMGRQTKWVWLTGGQLENLAVQAGHAQNPSLRERASEAFKDIRHAITKSSASKAALARLKEAETKIAPTQKFGLGKKHNPEGDAANLYEEFHGRPSREVVEVAYEEHEHETLTGLGDLCQLKIITPFKKDCVINVCPTKSPKDLPDPSQLPREDRIILSCSEDGKQLYFIGGDQSVDVEALGFGEGDMKDSMLLGVLYEVTYQAEKGFDKFQLTNYYHKLGEDTGVEPVLTYDPVSCLLKVSGGQYKVEAPGIIN